MRSSTTTAILRSSRRRRRLGHAAQAAERHEHGALRRTAMVRALMAAATSRSSGPSGSSRAFCSTTSTVSLEGSTRSRWRTRSVSGVLPPSYEGSASSTGIFEWYWGPKPGQLPAASQGSMSFIYSAIAVRGTHAHAEERRRRDSSRSRHRRRLQRHHELPPGYGKTVGLPYNEYALLGTDRNLAWWNPDITGPANAVAALVGKGKFMYLNGAKRYGYGAIPRRSSRSTSTSRCRSPRSLARRTSRTVSSRRQPLHRVPGQRRQRRGVASAAAPTGDCP